MGMMNRVASALGIRSAYGQPRLVNEVWDANDPSFNVPVFSDPAPTQRLAGQRQIRAAVRKMARDNIRVRTLIEKKVEITVGPGPRPKTRFKELNELWNMAKDQFDNRGDKDFGLWLGDDVVRNLEIDGEVFVRRRNRADNPAYADLAVPVQFQALPTEYVDVDFEGYLERHPYRFQNGVSIVNDRKQAFACWTRHPGEMGVDFIAPKRIPVSAKEMYQLFLASTGNPRGENPLAAGVVTMKDLADYEAAETSRKKLSVNQATFFEQVGDVDGLEKGGMPGTPAPAESDVNKAMRNLRLKPGDRVVLPKGLKAHMVQPAGEGTGHQAAVKLHAMLFSNLVGIPYFEAMNDWSEVPERAMRPATVSMKRNILRRRALIEHQVLNRMWRDFVTVCITERLWTPPADATRHEIFRVTWRWPVIQTVSIERELKAMAELVKMGLYAPEDFTEDYLGQDYAENTRRWTENVARAKVQGSTIYDDVWAPDGEIASSYMSVAEEEEAYERELVQAAFLDNSILKHPVF